MDITKCLPAISNSKPLIAKYICAIRKFVEINGLNVLGCESKNVLVERFSNAKNARRVKSIQFLSKLVKDTCSCNFDKHNHLGHLENDTKELPLPNQCAGCGRGLAHLGQTGYYFRESSSAW